MYQLADIETKQLARPRDEDIAPPLKVNPYGRRTDRHNGIRCDGKGGFLHASYHRAEAQADDGPGGRGAPIMAGARARYGETTRSYGDSKEDRI